MLAHQRARLVFSLAAGSREMRPLPLGQRAAARPRLLLSLRTARSGSRHISYYCLLRQRAATAAASLDDFAYDDYYGSRA